MKKIVLYIELLIELAIIVGLLWIHTQLYDYACSFLLLLIFPIIMICHWFLLRKKGFSKALQLKLFFLTGPIIILCISLILSINFELKRIRLVGGSTKEMGMKLVKMAQNKDDDYPDSISQWVNYNIKKMKSDTINYSMLLAGMCLLYSCRYNSINKDVSIKNKGNIPMKCTPAKK